MTPNELPLAEIFTSIHGEGAYAGTRMTFFRLAGCNVGRPLWNGEGEGNFPILPSGRIASVCTTYDGRTFPCDTDYSKKMRMTVDEMLTWIPVGVSHVCVTGGEPFIHPHLLLLSLVNKCRKRAITVHFETSGTVMVPDAFIDNGIYIACSPKFNYLPEFVNNFPQEIRLMVDEDFNVKDAERLVAGLRKDTQVYLAPLSLPHDVERIDPTAMARCLSLMENPLFKDARISLQMHKILKVR